jgi:hypothetical protein
MFEINGWRVGEFTKISENARGMSWVGWTMTKRVAEGEVSVGGVQDAAAVAAEGPVDADDREWSHRFATGDAWIANIQLRPGTSGWKPYDYEGN